MTRVFKVGDIVKDPSGKIRQIQSIKLDAGFVGRCRVTLVDDQYQTEFGSGNFVKFGEYNNEVGRELMREVVL